MPTLKKIVVQDFRNIAFQELSFSPNVNCISGNNGEGKTNLLDAIYYLSMTKSAFPAPDRYNWSSSRNSSVLRTCCMCTSAVPNCLPEMRIPRKVCCIRDFFPLLAGSYMTTFSPCSSKLAIVVCSLCRPILFFPVTGL